MQHAPNPNSGSIPDPKAKKPRRGWRRLPVSLRVFGAMLVVLCLGEALWTGVRVYRHWAAIREIQQANGTAEFESDAPGWLYQWVNDDWLSAFDRISQVTLPFSETLDANTRHLVALRPRPRLYVEGGPHVHELIRNGRLDEARSVLAKHRILLFSWVLESGYGGTPLHFAVGDGEIDIQQRAEFVRFLLEQGSEVDALNYFGTPLSYAAHPETVKLLLDHGADMTLDGPNSGVLAAAADAFTRGDAEHQEKWLEIAKLLRAAGAECDIVSACIINDLARVLRLLKSGRPAKIQDALRAAATWGRTDIVKVLLAAGADPNDIRNDKPVVYDAIRHADVLRIFFDHGIDAGVTYKKWGVAGWTLLHEAAETGAVESGRLLLNRGIPVDSPDADGQTPLHVAAISGRFAFVRFLLDHHADLNAQANGGVTAISYAASEYRLRPGVTMEPSLADRREVIDLLLAAGAPLDLFTAITLGRTDVARQLLAEKAELTSSRDCQRTSPMNRAVDLDQAEIVEVLLAAGADIDGKGDYEGSTALHKAAYLGRNAIVQILIAHKADLNTTDAYGETPLHRAALKVNPQSVRLLLEAGAHRNAQDPEGRTPLDVVRAPRFGTETKVKLRERDEVIQLLSEREESVSP